MSEQETADLSFLHNDEVSQFVRDGHYRWIYSEHELINNRMSWLVSANAFLFTPIAIMLSNGEMTSAEWVLVVIIAALGLTISVKMGKTIEMAVAAIKVVRDREHAHLREIEAETWSRKYDFVSPDRDMVGFGKRPEDDHDVSMECQVWVPRAISMAWGCLVFLPFFVRGL